MVCVDAEMARNKLIKKSKSQVFKSIVNEEVLGASEQQ